MSKLTTAARIFLGLAFTVFGLNFFFHFLPQPPMSGPPADFAGALFATGYMFPLIKGTEVLAGLLLLGNRFVTLALALLAPIVVNIVAFHAVLAGGAGLVLPLLLAGAQLYLAYAYRNAYAPMLAAKVEPAASAASHPAVVVAPAE